MPAPQVETVIVASETEQDEPEQQEEDEVCRAVRRLCFEGDKEKAEIVLHIADQWRKKGGAEFERYIHCYPRSAFLRIRQNEEGGYCLRKADFYKIPSPKSYCILHDHTRKSKRRKTRA